MVASDDVENTSLRSTLSTYCERIQRFFRYNSSGSGTTQPIRTEGAEQPRQREGESSEPEEVDNDAGDDPNIWKVRVNDLAYSDSRNYATNVISTAKYSLLSFLPKNIFEQFLRVANFYFLVLLILQVIPQISSLSPVTTALPLFLVLSVSAAKDGYDDFQRHRSDKRINNRVATVVTVDSPRQPMPWKSVRVGSILRLENDDFVAADILVLSTSQPNGLCYVETAELDGETNLKVKQAVECVDKLDEDQLKSFDGCVLSERPNNVLDRFEGTLHWNGETVSLDNSSMLLRGCKLKNTKWVCGVVIFAGHETKLMQNSGKGHFKRTKLDGLMNRLILWIFGFLLVLSIFCAVASSIWESVVGKDFLDYIPYADDSNIDNPHSTAALQFFSYLIVLNALVPISLYVSVEFIRLGQSFLINWDLDMYYEKTDTPAKARTTSLNEELGQIEYIFSDKTGTLTQNEMRFLKCTVRGKVYDGGPDSNASDKPADVKTGPVEPSPTKGSSRRRSVKGFLTRDWVSSRKRTAWTEDTEGNLNVPNITQVTVRISDHDNKDNIDSPDKLSHKEESTRASTPNRSRPITPFMASLGNILPGQVDEEPNDTPQDSASFSCQPPTKPTSPLAERDDAPRSSASLPRQHSSLRSSPPADTIEHTSKQPSVAEIEPLPSLTVPSLRTTKELQSNISNCGPTSPEKPSDCIDFPQLTRYGEEKFEFFDRSLLKAVRQEESDPFEFFHALAICHTVLSEQGAETLTYQAQSPDEAALVSAARNFGVAFVDRTPGTLTLDIHGVEKTYQVLCILDFNNVRKRMSVIVRRPDNRLFLYSKGADSVIFERTLGDFSLVTLTTRQLEMFARDGLRTLCVAKRELTEDEYNTWRLHHHEASTSLVDRNAKLDLVYEKIECNLQLIGASAVEDKLQEGVPETIAHLAHANMKIWVLTGDKDETAINIGYASRLLTADTDVHIVEGRTGGEVQTSLRRIKDLITLRRTQFTHETGIELTDKENPFEDPLYTAMKPKFALVINGEALTPALSPQLEMLFLETACTCRAVICCRVTPLQKAMVVELVKVQKKVITLAIGDGANDVGMIKAAHIGVGISGKEGMQAVLASDYSLAQFRFLERLLLVHGRWSFMRMCKFLSYFFYKNFAFVLVQFWYAFFCGFTAQTVYDPWFISVYNLIFTSLPVIMMGVTDQDVNAEMCLRYPRLYIPGQQNLLFNTVTFFKSLLRGIYVSIVVYFVTHLGFSEVADQDGIAVDALYVFGSAASGILVLIVNFQISLDTFHWTPMTFAVIAFSLLSFFIFLPSLYSPSGFYNLFPSVFYDLGVHSHLLGTAVFWFSLLLGVTMCFLPIVAIRFSAATAKPLLVDLLRRGYKPEEIIEDESSAPTPSLANTRQQTPSPASLLDNLPQEQHRRLASVGSTATTATGYAFSHTQGFGELITSGRAFLGNLVTTIATLPAPLLALTRANSGTAEAQTSSASVLVSASATAAVSIITSAKSRDGEGDKNDSAQDESTF